MSQPRLLIERLETKRTAARQVVVAPILVPRLLTAVPKKGKK